MENPTHLADSNLGNSFEKISAKSLTTEFLANSSAHIPTQAISGHTDTRSNSHLNVCLYPGMQSLYFSLVEARLSSSSSLSMLSVMPSIHVKYGIKFLHRQHYKINQKDELLDDHDDIPHTPMVRMVLEGDDTTNS